jgi:hypothetical protein
MSTQPNLIARSHSPRVIRENQMKSGSDPALISQILRSYHRALTARELTDGFRANLTAAG